MNNLYAVYANTWTMGYGMEIMFFGVYSSYERASSAIDGLKENYGDKIDFQIECVKKNETVELCFGRYYE